MNHLENYFQNEYNLDFSELQDVDNLLENVLPGFITAFDETKKEWPYSITEENDKNKTPPKKPRYSYSTNSMILNMMLLALDKAQTGTLFPTVEAENIVPMILNKKQTGWTTTVRNGLTEYMLQIQKEKATPKKHITFSNTYGFDDPLSILWCNKLVTSARNTLPESSTIRSEAMTDEILMELSTKIRAVSTKARKTSRNVCRSVLCKNNTPPRILDFGTENNKLYQQNIHPFLVLRLLYLELELFRTEADHSDFKSDFFNFFEKRLHLHLSYNDIPDSRFDPAELVFSLEGALLSGGDNSISSQTFERAFHVIEEYQNATPYWRPVNPLYSTKQGQILLPLSVEVANSLLRICVNRDIARKESPFSKHSSLFRRYFQWLKARTRQIKDAKGDTYFGWESEHVGSEKKIDLYQTSEIACFLINYRHMLQDRIARRSLEASGLQVDLSTTLKPNNYTNPTKYWGDGIERQESFLELDDSNKFKIYTSIKNKFISPRGTASPKDAKYSMMLYGPPGTGKTSVAKNLATALQWKMITITPSDFLAGGSGEVEARAKAIFRCLNEQKNSVILFDEIDHFLLDRESKEYHNQQGIFQFMTPGMLPKLKMLRDNERCIFIIATNFEERIDPAIKRKGRIDITYALMPPAFKQRYNIIHNFMYKGDNPIYPKTTSEHAETFITFCASSTALCTFTDLKEIKDLLTTDMDDSDLTNLMNANKMPRPSITTEAYFPRFFEENKTEAPDNPRKKTQIPLIECYLAILIKYQEQCTSDSFALKPTITLADNEKSILFGSSKEVNLIFERENLFYKELIQDDSTHSAGPTKKTSP